LKRGRLFKGYRDLERREKALAGALVVLLILAIASYGGGLWRGSWEEADEWELVTGTAYSQNYLYAPIVCDGTIYAGTYDGMLFAYTPADFDGTESRINTMVVCDGTIYAGTYSGHLLSYTPGVSTDWTVEAEPLDDQIIWRMIVYDGVIYAGTASAGKLFSFTPGVSSGWTKLSDQYLDQTSINALQVYDDTIYAGTSSEARLFAYTPGVAAPSTQGLGLGNWSPVPLEWTTDGNWCLSPTQMRLTSTHFSTWGTPSMV